MATFNEKSGNIDLSVEDVEMFKEIGSNFTPNGIRTPNADRIIKAIMPEELQDPFLDEKGKDDQNER